ncbi:MAG: hypothetical protein KGJ62_09920 [Armatimonadetes bacterium]|nr:hypothetical protein [Armatimonadota bacterium]MDE2208071.1 hypothetical protein [Armatimonadota bacterium]
MIVQSLSRRAGMAFSCALSLALIACGAASAQNANQTPSDQTSAGPASTYMELDQIDRLNALNKLHLTAKQDGDIATIITRQAALYTVKVNALAEKLVEPMKGEIAALKATMLVGGAMPADFEKRAKAIEDQFLAERTKLNMQNIVDVSTALKAILTKKQVDTAAGLSKDYLVTQGKGAGGTTDQMFNYFVLQEFVSYAGSAALLTEMQKAAGAPASPPSDGNP